MSSENKNQKAIDYFNGDVMSAVVWKDKYATLSEETPDDTLLRVAIEFLRVEKFLNTKFKNNVNKELLSEYGKNRKENDLTSLGNYFNNFKYIVPQGRVLSGLGIKDNYRSLSNCLRLPPPKDSYSSIMYSDFMLVSAAKRGCGYGLGISNLRPEGTFVKNSSNSSTGAVSFMPRFSNSTREVAQAGRRGACLIDIDIKHPDSLAFINSKKDRTKITGANISVKLSDEFMNAVEKDEDFILSWPDTANIDIDSGIFPAKLEYNTLIKGALGYYKKIKAKEYFENIIENAWENAEPGVFFWDRVKNYDPCSVYPQFQIDGTNACGEQPMCVYDTCRLILLNLFSFVKNPFTNKAEIDFELLYSMAYEQAYLGDSLVELEIEYIERIITKIYSDPEPMKEKQIELDLWTNVKKIAEEGRRVGCGITGLGDMLAALNLKYDSDEALKITDLVMNTKMRAELDCSIDLAIIREPFKNWDPMKEEFISNDWYKTIKEIYPEQYTKMLKYGRRFVNFSTIAPAGTISLMTQTTSGCEPLFQPFYIRRKKINPSEEGVKIDFIDQNGDSWTEFAVLHPKFKVFLELKGLDVNNLTKNDLQENFIKSPWYKCTANDINWSKRVKMQAILQKYTTSAISTTLNLPENVSKEEVYKIYMESWKAGLKGQTIYRDNCRTGVLVNESNINQEKDFKQIDAPKRPKNLKTDIYSVVSKGTRWNVLVGIFKDMPYEVFVSPFFTTEKKGFIEKIKKGQYNLLDENNELLREHITDFNSEEEENITRLISMSLRHGANVSFVCEQLNKTSGNVTSFSKAIARTLKNYIKDGTKSTLKCENCGESSIIFTENCQQCTNCGASKC